MKLTLLRDALYWFRDRGFAIPGGYRRRAEEALGLRRWSVPDDTMLTLAVTVEDAQRQPNPDRST